MSFIRGHAWQFSPEQQLQSDVGQLPACPAAETMILGTMSAVISISKQGTLTLPRELWLQLGLPSSGRVVAQETKRGILLRAEAGPAVKPYSKARVARIAKAEAGLTPFVADMKASLARARSRGK